MVTPVGAVFNETTRVEDPVGAATGFTLTVWSVPGPLIRLHVKVMLVLSSCSRFAAFMVPVKMKAKTAKDLNGGTICTSAGTNNARYVADFLKVNNIKAEVLTFEKREEQRAAYAQGRCDADMNWGPTLAVTRASQADAKEHVILPDVVAVAPQVIIVKESDDHYLDVINWVLEALLIAEENGITRANIDQIKAKPPNPSIEKLLGVTPGMGARLGLSDQWAYNTIKAMGNFGEIYERNLGSQSPYKLDRGMNALWRDKGVFVPMLID